MRPQSITKIVSIGVRSAIVATFVTTLVVPVVDSAHHLVGHAYKPGGSKNVRCTPGKALQIEGETFTCRSRIIQTKRMLPTVKLCQKTLWWLHGQCVGRDAYLRAHATSAAGP